MSINLFINIVFIKVIVSIKIQSILSNEFICGQNVNCND